MYDLFIKSCTGLGIAHTGKTDMPKTQKPQLKRTGNYHNNGILTYI